MDRAACAYLSKVRSRGQTAPHVDRDKSGRETVVPEAERADVVEDLAGMQPPMAGRLIVRCISHPSEVAGEVIFDEEFDASRWTGRQIADVAIARVRQVSPGLEYDARVIERDTSWGADASAVEVILDVSSRIADFGGIAALVQLIREGLKDRMGGRQQDDDS